MEDETKEPSTQVDSEAQATIQSEKFDVSNATDTETARSLLDEVEYRVNIIALTNGASPELAAAQAREEGIFARFTQLRGFEPGAEEGIRDVEDEAWERSRELQEYADGTSPNRETVQNTLSSRVDKINHQLDQVEPDFTHDKIADLTGISDPYELHMAEQRFRELSELRDRLKPTREAAEQTGASPETQEQEAEASPEYQLIQNQAEEMKLTEKLKIDGPYTPDKGTAVVLEAAREVYGDSNNMASELEALLTRFEAIQKQGDTIHGDKSEDQRVMWSEKNLYEGMRKSDLWKEVEKQIAKRPAKMGMGRQEGASHTITDMVMSDFLKFAGRTLRSGQR